MSKTRGPLFIVLCLSLLIAAPSRAAAQMDMLPQLFRDLPPELQEGLPSSMTFQEYRRLNRNVDFFTMFMSGIVPGYAHFQVEKPVQAWTVAGVRLAGYGMMALAVGRQWDDWRDLSRLDSIPDPRYRHYLENAFLFAGGIFVNGMAWAFDVLGAYHIAKQEKDLVIYKYGLQEGLGARGDAAGSPPGSTADEEEREIAYIRRLTLQDGPAERQVRSELERSLHRYIEAHPSGEHRGEVEFYLGSRFAENEEPELALLHLARAVYLFPQQPYTRAARRAAIGLIQRYGAPWEDDRDLLLDMFSRTAGEADPPPGRQSRAYLAGFRRLETHRFRELYIAEALLIARTFHDQPYADDALLTAAAVAEELGRTEEAIVIYTELVGIHPESDFAPFAMLQIGKLLTSLGEREYAARFYRRLLEFAPESPEAEAARRILGENNS